MTAALNWKEIEILADRARQALFGKADQTGSPLRVKGLWIASRPEQAAGFLKNEWILEFHLGSKGFLLLLNARVAHPYCTVVPSKEFSRNASAPLSPFGLFLERQLEGAMLRDLKALPRERGIQLSFERPGNPSFELFFVMIPSAPELALVEGKRTLARSRAQNPEELKPFSLPAPGHPPDHLPIRESLASNSPGLDSFSKEFERLLLQEAFEQRLKTAQSALRSKIKSLEKKLRQSEQALQGAHQEKNWQSLADLLKAALPLPHPPRGQTVDLEHPLSGEKIEIPWDPKLSPGQNLKRLYELAKKNKTRFAENQARYEASREDLLPLKRLLDHPPEASHWPLDWRGLAGFETRAGTAPASEPPRGRIESGKSFRSREGLLIYVGRNAAENMEITFQQARGNDLWMHLKGKPGAHAIIALPSKRTASLDTLLDAAQLVIHYSGGSGWGKTEVDYTFRKNVKRTKNSRSSRNNPKDAPVHYTQAKTLVVEPDPNRLKSVISRNGE